MKKFQFQLSCSRLGEVHRQKPKAKMLKRQSKRIVNKFVQMLSTAICLCTFHFGGGLLLPSTVLLLGTTTQALTCPVETDLWGATDSVAGPPNIETYKIITDEEARITHIRSCMSHRKSSGIYGNFQGFEVTFDGPTSGITKLSYATTEDSGAENFACFTDAIAELKVWPENQQIAV